MLKAFVVTILIGICLCACESGCVLDPEVTEGPYYVNLQLIRYDVREDKSGIPLFLNMTVVDYNTCEPVSGAGVEIWHCDASGIYSHFEEASENVSNPQTDDTTYLRGVQVSNSNGDVGFLSIYPGWYEGRALHIHLKVHLDGSDGTVVHTGQLFFEEELNSEIEVELPYSSHDVDRVLNADDNIYNGGGSYGLITSWEYVGSSISDGIIASITLGVDSTLVSSNTSGAQSSDQSSSTGETSSAAEMMVNVLLLLAMFVVLF